MYRKQDYPFFIFGVALFAGLGLVPVIWGSLSGIAYKQALLPSIISCTIFLFAFNDEGKFSLLRFFGGMVFALLLVFKTSIAAGSSKPFFIAGGIFGFLIMFACGWVGIWIGRLFRPIKLNDKSDPYSRLILLSHKQWKSGKVKSIFTLSQQDANAMSQEAFADKYYKYRQQILNANNMRAFEKDEYLIDVQRGVYLVTNRALYTLKPIHVSLLADIKKYEVDEGFMSGSMIITLNSGEVIKTKRSNALPPIAMIRGAKALK